MNGNRHYPPLIQALSLARAYSHPTADIRIVETHISWLVLTGDYVYKIKKPVNFGFLDFSTLAQRRFYCAEELRLNQRLAADWYLEVVPITGTPDHPTLGGDYPVIEYAVKMRQFAAGQLLAEHAAGHCLEARHCEQLAEQIADFHSRIAHAEAGSPYGESATIRHWADENFTQLAALLSAKPDNATALRRLSALQAWTVTEGQRRAESMQTRKRQGYVRECHGDLHLGNMTLINDRVLLFDCIEFNPELRWIDVVSDTAFLLVDLAHFGYHDYAYRVLNRYLSRTGDYAGLGVLRYYLVYRALVRAKIALLGATQQSDAERLRQARAEYAVYANIAERFAADHQPLLLITHGYSGSGKSTFAARWAEQAGAIHLRSDIERKRLFGYRAEQASGGRIYTAAASEQTYSRLAELATIAIDAGFSAVVDATFLHRPQRQRFRQLADQIGAPFVIVDCDAPEAVLTARIRQRQSSNNDASEATPEVLRRQRQNAEPLSADERLVTAYADQHVDAAIARIASRQL